MSKTPSLQCPLLRISKVYFALVIVNCVCGCLMACGPGPVPRPTRKTPMKFKQRIPDVDEVSIQASGDYVGPVERGSEAYEDLEKNYNPDIVFKKTDNNDDNRRMTKVTSDQNLFCSYNICALTSKQVMRIKNFVSQVELFSRYPEFLLLTC